MKRNFLATVLGGIAALGFTFVLVMRGEDAPPPAPAAPASEQVSAPATAEGAQPATPAAAKPAEPVAPPAAPAPSETAAPAPKPSEPAAAAPELQAKSTELRRLDADSGDSRDASATNPPAERNRHRKRHVVMGSANKNGRVSIFNGTSVSKDEREQVAVSIFGSTTVDGDVSDAAVSVGGSTTVNGSVGDAAVSVGGNTTVSGSVGDAAVAVGGNTTVDGSVGDAAVAVGGDVTVNGHVHGEVVSIGGRVKLGPDAIVDGGLVVVGGDLERDPSATIHGEIQRVRLPMVSWFFAWVRSALFRARLLSFAPAASWAWAFAFMALGLYLVLALVFPRAMTKCAETLEQRPGYVVLTAFLMTLAMPLVIALLAITGVGVFVIPVLGTCLLVARVFGRGVMLAWIGRRFAGFLGTGASAQIAVAVLIGGVVVMGLYLVPVVALIVAMLLGWLGLGTVVYTLILSGRRNGKKPVLAGPGAPVVAPALGAASAETAVATAPAGAVPPVVATAAVPAAMLPRAGFWIRLVASFLDCILLSVTAAMVHLSSLFLLLFAAYCVVLWALKGTTIGGIVCGLKVVRLDERPIDWTVAIVRALAGFLSLAIIGLGFIWVAFDDEKQSWHDKIAGTTIVKMPKGVSLV